jgi:hypothetical protein
VSALFDPKIGELNNKKRLGGGYPIDGKVDSLHLQCEINENVVLNKRTKGI